MKPLKLTSVLLLMLGSLLLPIAAHAAPPPTESGWVTGSWTFWNKNGNYCPAGRNCTGAVYLESAYDSEWPLPNIQVFVENDSVGTIGTGFTDSFGQFTIQWSVGGVLPNKSQTYVWVRPYHRDGRFFINTADGSFPWAGSEFFTAQVGTTQASPQPVGPYGIGNSASPNNFFNAYWAAELSWRRRLATSGWFLGRLANTEIRGFADIMPGFLGDCSTSCAGGNTVQLDDNAGFSPQSRMMHEYGHVAITNSQAWNPTSDCYSKGANIGWDLNTDEWACAAWEEGLATFLADSTLYNHNAIEPHTCQGSFSCTANTFNIEASSHSACATGERGWALSQIRYFWDIFDSRDDGETISEGSAGNWWRIYRTYQHYPTGTGTNQNNEHWNPSFTALDSKDGRGARSFRQNYINSYGLETTTARGINCNPQ